MQTDRLSMLLSRFREGRGQLCVLTGAGISAESGIPTFRGPEGYWRVGSKNYRPEELATQREFSRNPREVWRWYLHRRTICRRASPNAGHRALVDIERALPDRFTLVTQNVDGLHARAGSADPLEIHGCIDRFRCSVRCTDATYLLPDDHPPIERDTPLSDDMWHALRCPDCGRLARPHVLWFDEYYDEVLFRSVTALERASTCDLLLVVGTSGATNLPIQIGMHCAQSGIPVIDINPNDNPFGRLADASGGVSLRAPSGDVLPRVAAELRGA